MNKNYISLLIFILSSIFSYSQPSITCPNNVNLTCPYEVPSLEPVAYNNFNTVILQTWSLFGATSGSSPATGINDLSLVVFQFGTTTVTYYVQDNLGNSATCNFNVTITDSQAPLLICPIDITTSNDPGLCSAIVNDFGFMSAWDNCSGISLELISGLPRRSAFPVGTTTNIFKFTDAAGNSSTCTFNINVVDNDKPIVNCPTNITAFTTPGQCNANVTVPLATATDNCSVVSIANNYNAGGANASGTYPLGTTLVTFTATDTANNIATCIMSVTVINSQSPVITLLGANSITLEACSSYTELGATASDTCLGDISGSIVIDQSALNTTKVGTYVVTYNVLGAAQVIRTVNVVDTTKPSLSLVGPNPLTIGDCSTFTELGAVAIDPCFGNISGNVIIDNSTVNPGVLGSYTVTYNVTDASGNTATQITRTVNVIDVNLPQITLNGDNPQIIEACTSYVEGGATAYDPCSGTDISASLVVNTSAVDTNTVGTYNVTYNVTDGFGNSAIEVIRTVNVVDATIISNAGSDYTNTVCTETTITLAANAVSGNSTGLWSVASGQTRGFSFSDPTSPTATFIGDVGEVYELTWSINNPCGISSDSVIVTFIGCNALDFDGLDDNVSFRNNYNLTGDFTIEVWIKSELSNGNIQTILSKRDANNQIDGYDLRLVNNLLSFNWNSQSLIAPYPISVNKWSHVAVTYGGGTYSLFIDGLEVNSSSGSQPVTNNAYCILGAMDQPFMGRNNPVNYFNGGMDELRIWNVALSTAQIRKMMNQEIEDDLSGNVKGSVVPLNITGLLWSDLNGYYQMNQSSDLSAGRLLSLTNAVTGRLRLMTTFQPETAPLPYKSLNDGNWTSANTWLYGYSQAIPNSLGVDGSTPINWNIVTTSHTISSGNNNITVLGLLVNDKTVSIQNSDPLNGQSLRVTDYLKIDGSNTVLKLVGESQLLQDMGSIVDYSGSGKLHRDQQGTSNLFNYNYWGSPVSLNGANYNIGNILYDGTQPVLWTTARDAVPGTTPITMSSRWLYLYENFPINSYADWKKIDQNTTVQVGLGFLMKGSGASTDDQNYTFVGKPNNGTITSPITANFEALVGNPYPSAIDAHEFIDDNSSSTTGIIYYWEHYETNNTHVLSQYQGGFAAYSKSGGIAAVSPPEVSDQGSPTKIPERYIPVGQGFNVNGNTAGGTVIFENDQRVFVKEAVTGALNNGSVFMRMAGGNSKNSDTKSVEDPIQRVRISFIAPNGAIRPLLLAFVPNNLATDEVDYGYDALNTDNFPFDMTWIIEGDEYIIQGVGDFMETKQLPLKVMLASAGNIEVALQDLENFDTEIDVYIYDAVLNTYTRINDINYQYNLEAGEYNDRFFLTFMDANALSVIDQNLQNFKVSYLMKTNEIYMKIPSTIDVSKVHVYNMLGQNIKSWDVRDTSLQSNELRLPFTTSSEGYYVIKVETASGTISKKVIIKD